MFAGLLRNRSTLTKKFFIGKCYFLLFGSFYCLNRQKIDTLLLSYALTILEGLWKLYKFRQNLLPYTSYKKFLILLIRLSVLIPNQVISINKAQNPLVTFNKSYFNGLFPFFFQIRHILCQKLKMYVEQIFESKS